MGKRVEVLRTEVEILPDLHLRVIFTDAKDGPFYGFHSVLFRTEDDLLSPIPVTTPSVGLHYKVTY